jgi:hypothetical protein
MLTLIFDDQQKTPLTNSKKSQVLLLWSIHTDKRMDFLYVQVIINPLHEKIIFHALLVHVGQS